MLATEDELLRTEEDVKDELALLMDPPGNGRVGNGTGCGSVDDVDDDIDDTDETDERLLPAEEDASEEETEPVLVTEEAEEELSV